MQKSFLLGVLLISFGGITMSMEHQTPTTQPSRGMPAGRKPSPMKFTTAPSTLNPCAIPWDPSQKGLNRGATLWRGCYLPTRTELSPVTPLAASNGSFSATTPATVAAASPDSDFMVMERAASLSPYQDPSSYPSPTTIMAIMPQQGHPRLLDGEECAKRFAADQRRRAATEPFDKTLKEAEAYLAILQARAEAQRAIVAQIQRIINAEEPTARQEIVTTHQAITQSMLKKQHVTDDEVLLAHQQRNDARHQEALLLKEAAHAKKARLKNLVTFVKEEPTDAHLIQQRLESVKALQTTYPFPLDPTQICSLTGEIFDTKTGKTVNF